jgi:hypothetical protein
MKQYEISLKNDKTKQYNRIALFIIIINLALFIYLSIFTEIKSIRLSTFIAAAFIFTILLIDYFFTFKKNNANSSYKIIAEYIICIMWLQIGYWWIATLCFLLATLYLIAKRPLLVKLVEGKITYPSFPKKIFSWSDLNNIMIKDGLLTIDLKNNSFIQQSLDETKTPINEQEFNDFCREQMNK